MIRTILVCVGAAAIVSCVRAPRPQLQPEAYAGATDPAYNIAEELKAAHLAPREGRMAAARFQQDAQQVHERVQTEPAFGGFILRWTPAPHAVVMFTGDAEARLRRYTTDPRFRALRVELTLLELERMKDRFGNQLSRLGLSCFSVDGDEEHNSVTVGAPAAELAKVQAAIRAGAVKAPPKLRLVEQRCPEFR